MTKELEGLNLMGPPPPPSPPAEDTLVAIRATLESMSLGMSRDFGTIISKLESIDGRLASIDEKLGRLDNLGKLDVIAHQLNILVQYATSSKPS